MNRRIGSVIAVAFVVMAAGCGLLDSDDAPSDIARYFPLAEGNEWTYVQTRDYGSPETNTVSVSVTSLQGTSGRLSMQASATGHAPAESYTETLVADSDRVVVSYHWFSGVHETLLRAPIARGASWQESYSTFIQGRNIEYSGVATIVATDTTISVNGRTYRRVVAVRYVWSAAPDIVNTPTIDRYFAPGVGIVRMDFAFPCVDCGNGGQALVRHRIR